jgi:ribosome-associated protein
MTNLSIKNSTAEMVTAIEEGLISKKGIDPLVMDFSNMQNIAFERFIICTGSSGTHANALADAVIDTVISQCKDKPWHVEGRENAEWILLDYGNIVVHIFQPEKREFYKLEALWADADIRQVTE